MKNKKTLPKGWLIKKMPEVVTWGSGGTPKATEEAYYKNGTIPWLVIGDLNDGIVTKSHNKITKLGLRNSNAKIIPVGTLMVAMYGSIGKLGITGIECCTNQAIAFAKELHGVSTKYMFYYMTMLKSKLISMGKGGTQKNISQTVLKSLNVIVPPITVQGEIVAHIEELFSQLDKGVETLQTIKQQLTVYRQAVLKEAFEGKWSYSFRTKVQDNINFRNLKDTEIEKLANIPSEWRYVYLSDLGDLSRGKSKHRPRNDARLFENGKYPFFQTGDVKSATKELVNCNKKYGEFGLAQSKLWPAGTLCITIAANIAETCFLGVDGCFPDSIVGFTPYDNIVNKEYVRYFIESSKIRIWAFAPATAQKNINLTTLENLVIPYCNLDEQSFIVQAIESRLSVCDSIEQTVDAALTQAEALRQSILKKAFEGGFS